jgi:hypothetical protein
MNITEISPYSLDRILQSLGIDIVKDFGPSGELVEMFDGSKVESRYEVGIYDVLQKVGLSDADLQEICEQAVREAIEARRADIEHQFRIEYTKQRYGS